MNLIENATKEKKLQDLLENRDVGDEKAKKKAELTMMVYRELEGISYDECMVLHNEAVDILKHMTPHDIAFDFMLKQRDTSLKYAGALNDLSNMGRTDHLVPIHGLVSIGNTCVEVTLLVKKLGLRTDNRKAHIQSEIIDRVYHSSLWSPGLRHGVKLDFIEL